MYWYKFNWNGELIRESTKQGNPRIARQIEAAHQVRLAKGEAGIREPKRIPTVAEFCSERYRPWARATFETTSAKSWAWYRVGIAAIEAYKKLAETRLCDVNGEMVADFAAHRLGLKHQISSVNSVLRVLRRGLKLAVEWEVTDKAPKIRLLPGERHRDRVLGIEEEGKYLRAATSLGDGMIADYRRALEGIRATVRGEQPIEPRDPYLLRDTATQLLDTGLRPEECFRLRWAAINWQVIGKAPNGTLQVTHGKTPCRPEIRATHPACSFPARDALGAGEQATGRMGLARANAERPR